MILTDEQSVACYRAAYEGFGRNWRSGFDVVIDLERPDCRGTGRFGARATSSGCAVAGDTVVFQKLQYQ